jgi:molybdopterin-guanine dinucleotide biosynthesis protein MobB
MSPHIRTLKIGRSPINGARGQVPTGMPLAVFVFFCSSHIRYNIHMSILIGITGAHSGSGKTVAGCALLKHLTDSGKQVGAIKCTPDSLYTSVVDDFAVLSTSGKDTALYLQAGAASVRWVRSTREDMLEALSLALDSLADCPIILIEGNTAVEVLKPDIVLFIVSQLTLLKPTARVHMSRADVLLYRDELLPDEYSGKVFHADDLKGYAAHVLRCMQGVTNG